MSKNDGPDGDVDELFTDGWRLFLEPLDGEIVVRKELQSDEKSLASEGAQLRDVAEAFVR
jgi:hypothetical protein